MARGSTGRGRGDSGDASKKDTEDRSDSTSDSPAEAESTESAAKSAAKSSAESSTKDTAEESAKGEAKDSAKSPKSGRDSKANSAVRQAAKVSAKSNRSKGASGSAGSRPGKSAAKASGSKGGGRPPRGKGRGAVGGRRVPWVLVLATVGVLVFAGVAIGYAVNEVQDAEAKEAAASASKDPNRIEGITEKGFPGGQHTTNAVSYGDIPPFGGAHDPEWADCTGTVYPEQIRTENVVHSLEHGAVWITYLPGIPQEEIDALAAKVEGKDFMLMSPYPGQPTQISLQSWGFQLQVQTADDPRIDEFIHSTRLNPELTPEYGATCANPQFKESPRLPGEGPPAAPGPTDGPVTDSPNEPATTPAPAG